MAKYSRDKGARGELLFRDLCREHGYTGVIRTAQHSGKGGTADVTGLPGIHVEVKFVERLNIRDAMAQSIRDAEPEGTLPIVAHKKRYAPWLITMQAEDFFRLYREWRADDDTGRSD